MAKMSGLTAKQVYGKRLLALKPEDFPNPNTFTKNGEPDIHFATIMNSTFSEQFSVGQLSEIIFAFYKKWPVSRSHSELVDMTSALVYYTHYKFWHRVSTIPERVEKRLKGLIDRIELGDKKPSLIAREKRRKRSGSKDVGDEVAMRLRGMDIGTMVEWEKELGVTEDVIQKQLKLSQKSMGLARMQISNRIRKMVNASKKEEQ